MRRARKIFLWSMLVLLTPLALLCGVAAGFVWLAGPQTWTSALETITDQASSPEFRIETGSFHRDADGILHLDSLRLLDQSGMWLQADGVVLNINPMALFGGRADIEALTVQRIQVLREPVATAPAEPEPDTPLVLPDKLELPQLPVAVRLGLLRVDELVLSEGLASEQVRLRIDGSAGLTPEAQSLMLDVLPLDLGQSYLRAAIRANRDTAALEVDISGDLPVIAPLQAAVQAPPGSRMTLNVRGGGPLDAARLELDASLDGIADLVGDLAISVRGDAGASAQLHALVNLIGGVAAEPAALIGSAIEIRADMALPDTTLLRIENLAVHSAHLALDVSGAATLETLSLDLTGKGRFGFHDGLADMLQGATFSQTDLTLQLKGPLDDLKAETSLAIQKAQFENYSVELATLGVSAVTDLQNARGGLTVTLAGVATGEADLDRLAGAEVVLATGFQADPERVRLSDLTFRSAVAVMSGDVAVRLSDLAATGAVQIQAADLAQVPQLADLLTAGRTDLDLTFEQFTPADGTLAIKAALSEVIWRDSEFSGLVGSKIALTGEAALGETVSATFDLTSGGQLDGRFRLGMQGEALQGTYQVGLKQLPVGLAPPELDGLRDISLSGRVSGTTDRPVTSGQLTAGPLQLDGIDVAAPRIAYTARDLTGDPVIEVDAGADLMGSPLGLRTLVRTDLSNDLVSLEQTRLSFRTLALEATLGLNLTTSLAAGQVLVASHDLSAFSDLAGVDLAGDLATQIDLTARGSAMDSVVLLEGTALRADVAQIGKVAARIELTDLLADAPGLSGWANADTIQAEGAVIETVAATLGGNASRPALDLTVQAIEPAAARLTTSLSVDLSQPEATRIAVANLILAAKASSITAQSPFDVELQGEAVRLSGLNLTTSFGGSVTGQAEYGPMRVTADLDVAGLPVGPLAAIGGANGFGGQIDAQVRVDTDAADRRAAAIVTLAGLTVPDLPPESPFVITLNAGWQGDQANAALEVRGPFQQPLLAQATGLLPYQPGSPIPTPPPEGSVSGKVSWQGDLSRLMALLPESDHLVSGESGIDVSLDGTWATPRLVGLAHLTDARYENLLAGTILQQIGLQVRFDDAGNGQFTLQAADPEGGTVAGQGKVVLIGKNKAADISITLQKLLAVRRDEARALVSGTTNVTWDGSQVNVFGRHVLDRVDIFLAAPDLPPSVVEIELERDKVATVEEAPVDKESPLQINLDVRVTSDGQFFVRGRGLESEWRGTLAVTGSADDPLVQSDFSVIRGNLALLGRDFKLDVGELGLAEDGTPSFRIELLRETPDLTGRIIVSGNPAQPDISFSSIPELPQEEVLPRLFFGKSNQSLSPLEALNLAQGIRTLTNGKPGATDQIRDAVGLDVLRFEEGDTAESAGAVSVGRYIREGVYVGAKKSVDSSAGSVVVEIDLLPNIKVDAEVVPEGGSSTGITWEKKY